MTKIMALTLYPKLYVCKKKKIQCYDNNSTWHHILLGHNLLCKNVKIFDLHGKMDKMAL